MQLTTDLFPIRDVILDGKIAGKLSKLLLSRRVPLAISLNFIISVFAIPNLVYSLSLPDPSQAARVLHVLV